MPPKWSLASDLSRSDPSAPDSAASMTTRGCCHLPGSLCDCASSADPWKNVEEAAGDGCQPLYVTQVTALDGRLLSSVLRPAGAQR